MMWGNSLYLEWEELLSNLASVYTYKEEWNLGLIMQYATYQSNRIHRDYLQALSFQIFPKWKNLDQLQYRKYKLNTS